MRQKIFILSPFFLLLILMIFVTWGLSTSREFKIQATNTQKNTISKNYNNNESLTFLFLGKPGDGFRASHLTDTIIIGHLNAQRNKAYLLSIPRDLWVQIPQTSLRSKINYLNAYENLRLTPRQGQESFTLIKQKVNEITGLQIDYVVSLNLNGLIKFIDAINGINIFLENDLVDFNLRNPHNPREIFRLKAGWHYLDGRATTMLVRSRFGSGGDFYRIAHQQSLIKALSNKLTQLNQTWGLLDWLRVWQSLQGYLTTDLSLPSLFELIRLAREVNIQKIESSIISNRGDNALLISDTIIADQNSGQGIYVLLPRAGFNNYEEIRNYVQKNIIENN